MPSAENDATAQEDLRRRQGKGARYDAPNAPADDLILARRGTAFFARLLTGLPDDSLAGSSARPGRSRAHIVAEVGYDARHQALALEAMARGKIYVPVADGEDKLPEIELATTLPVRALRFLFRHSEVHLNVCWRDLKDDQWDRPVTLVDGTVCVVRDLPRIRARRLWHSAIDLSAGGQVLDLPEPLRSP